jgi:hypothetical protein
MSARRAGSRPIRTTTTAGDGDYQFAALPTPASGVSVTNVLVDDSWADGNRTNAGPLQADWWSTTDSAANSIEVYTNQLGLVTGTSGRSLHGTFPPQVLELGDTVRATYTFTTSATVGNNRSTAFRVAMFDFNNTGLAADLLANSSNPQPLYTNLPGYMVDHDVNTGATADQNVRKHNVNISGRGMSTTSEYTALGNSGIDFGFPILTNTEYTGVFSVTRTDFEEMSIQCSLKLAGAGTNLTSITRSDVGDIANNFGMLGFHANSSTFGSVNTKGEFADNGITFSNIKIEVITVETPAPELNIAQAGSDVVLSWLTAGSDGFLLESTTSLSSPSWSSNGPPPVIVGDSYVVTNAATGIEKYYRLAD